MFSWTTIASIVVSGTGLLGVISYLANQWYGLRRLAERVKALEDQEQSIQADCLPRGEHDEMQAACKAQIYRDIRVLEDKMSAIDSRLRKGEEAREIARAEDTKWKIEIHEAIVEIRTIVKERWRHQQRPPYDSVG